MVHGRRNIKPSSRCVFQPTYQIL